MIRPILTLFLLLSGLNCAAAFGRQGGAETIGVRVRLHDADEVSGPILAAAKEVAADVLVSAGIRAVLEDASARPHRTPKMTRDDSRLEAETIDVRFIYSTPLRLAPGSLANSLPFARNGIRITVFFDRVEDFGRHEPLFVSRVLGHVLAHEVGHILLGTKEHSATGVMKAHWDEHDSCAIGTRGLRFTAGNAAEIQLRRAKARSLSDRSLRIEGVIEGSGN